MTPDPKHAHEDYGCMSGFTRDRWRDREKAYAKALAETPIDPESKVVILPIMSPSKAMLLNKQMEASNEK